MKLPYAFLSNIYRYDSPPAVPNSAISPVYYTVYNELKTLLFAPREFGFLVERFCQAEEFLRWVYVNESWSEDYYEVA